ncbi:MAG: 30S ribosomal protein S6 [Holosporales bacterium]|jgi:small subunit ribosomal protein S6|nr:30S ribosomal protein S6 [Holosporales bacterium]
MKFYETVFIVKQDASSSHVESVAQEIVAIIKEQGGEVTKTEFCGLRYLAYPINKNRRGHYVLLNIAIDPARIKEIERKLKLNEDVVRFLTVRTDRLDNSPSSLMKRTLRDG